MSPQKSPRALSPSDNERQRDALIADLQDRIVELPEAGTHSLTADFDPLDPGLDGATCLGLGIPPRPTDARALALWQRMVAPDLVIEPFRKSDVRLLGRIGHSLGFRTQGPSDALDEGQEQAGAVVTGGGRLASSANWCGAAILPRDGERFVQVLATWTVPPVVAGVGPGPWACSTWIGLDGLRRWMGSMPQMGTTQSVGEIDDSGYPPNFPWWQWWLRGRGIQEPVPLPIPVKAGDTVYCALTRLPRGQPGVGDEHHVQFFLRVNGIAMPIIVEDPPSNADDAKVASRGASAQWILERPTALKPSPNGHVKEGDLFPLPDFGAAGTVEFAASMAPTPDQSGIVASIEAPRLSPARSLRTPRLLRMVQALGDPPRIAVIAKPSLAADGRLTVRYRRP